MGNPIPLDKDSTLAFVGKFALSIPLILKFISAIDILSSLSILDVDGSVNALSLGTGEGSPRSLSPLVFKGEGRFTSWDVSSPGIEEPLMSDLVGECAPLFCP